jgi:hypothetical protein
MKRAPGAASGGRARVSPVSARRLARGSASSGGKASISGSLSSRAKPLRWESRWSRVSPRHCGCHRDADARGSRGPRRAASGSSQASSPASTARAMRVAVAGLVIEPQCQQSPGSTRAEAPAMRRPAQVSSGPSGPFQPAASAGTARRRRRRSASRGDRETGRPRPRGPVRGPRPAPPCPAGQAGRVVLLSSGCARFSPVHSRPRA